MQTYIEGEGEASPCRDEEFMIHTPSQPIQYYNEKLFDIIGNIFKVKPSELTCKIPETLIDTILLSTKSNGRYNIDVTAEGAHYFMGYPDCNFMKQLTAILTLWNERLIFPVTYLTMSEMEDDTAMEIERLNTLTDEVNDVFKSISTESQIDCYKKVKEMLIAFDVRGFMTIFGIRTSPGSQNEVWPRKSALLEAVNKRHKKERLRPRVVHPNNTSILTVGGRALAKHSGRSVDKFWGNCDGKTESYKNEAAFAIVQQILNE